MRRSCISCCRAAGRKRGDGMADVIRDVLMGKLFGTSGTSSGGGSSGGGGSVGVSPKEVNFYDYDGTCVHAYTVAEAQALSELPAGPEHPGLVFQGWNWSLEGVKGVTRAMNIGAMYTTDDGTTRLYITLQEGRTSPMLGVGVNGKVTVDWGDGTEPDVLTGTSVSTTVWTPNHAYAAPGDYVIRLTVDGEMAFTGESSTTKKTCILRYASGADARNAAYQNSLHNVEIGDNVTTFRDYAFQGCYALVSVSFPPSVKNIGMYAFDNCHSLSYSMIPNSVVAVDNYMYQQCRALKITANPESLTEIGSSMYWGCLSLQTMTIPSNVTTIKSSAFKGCSGLVFMSIPKSVTEIGSYAFQTCSGLACVDFTACSAVPTMVTTYAFDGIPADCEIRVPAALYDEWIAATNWATYADHVKAY